MNVIFSVYHAYIVNGKVCELIRDFFFIHMEVEDTLNYHIDYYCSVKRVFEKPIFRFKFQINRGRAMLRHDWDGSTGVTSRPHREQRLERKTGPNHPWPQSGRLRR